jgi:hypothetical protein
MELNSTSAAPHWALFGFLNTQRTYEVLAVQLRCVQPWESRSGDLQRDMYHIHQRTHFATARCRLHVEEVGVMYICII